MRKDIELCISDLLIPNAFSMGERTIVVTKGRMESMTEEQINSKLTMFVMPTEGVRPPQNPDGSFPVIKTAEETPTFLNPVPAVEEQ